MIAGAAAGRPGAVKIGIAAALVLAGLYLAALPWGPLRIVPALVLMGAALGLRNGHAWSGYGGALFLAARWAGDVVAMTRFEPTSKTWAWVAIVAAPVGLVAYLLFRAGRALPETARGRSRWGWIVLATLVFLVPQALRAYWIPTGAMEDTLPIGDQLLVRVLGVPAPSRGDIIVFRYPADIRQTFVTGCWLFRCGERNSLTTSRRLVRKASKFPGSKQSTDGTGAPGGTRTSGLLVRSQCLA
jgi:hypothetical protein